MSYMLDSDRLNAYPSTKRASVNKLLTENSVTRIINRLIDSDSYVITNGLDGIDYTQDIPVDIWSNNEADFEFVVHGYYFSISKENDASGLMYLINKTGFVFSDNAPHTLYGRIFIDKTDSEYPELYGQDDIAGKYQAIKFYIDQEDPVYPDGGSATDYDFYDIPLVSYTSSDSGSTYNVRVPLSSLFKFNSRSIANIDGGEIIL